MSLQDEEIGSVMMKVENVGRNLGRRKKWRARDLVPRQGDQIKKLLAREGIRTLGAWHKPGPSPCFWWLTPEASNQRHSRGK